MAMLLHGLALLITTMTPCPQDPLPGIDRQMAAVRRAHITDLRYELKFSLDRSLRSVSGQGRIVFVLPDDAKERPLVLDFAGEDLSDLRVNGVEAFELPRVANHLVVPTDLLVPGENEITARFRSAVGATGTPLTLDHDGSSGEDYLYTLLVPADAHILFPCFDQPDLKARYALTIDAPADWKVVANTDGNVTPLDGGRRRHVFAVSEPLPTYLFAFAAGPFAVIECGGRRPESLARPMRLYVRPGRVKDLDSKLICEMHANAVSALEDEFGVKYPFGKLDAVLLQGFPYRGMEHAGAIFYRESSLVFDHAPTSDERIRRSTLIYHEVTHQWFGNLVTMEWFDDLWLKEGFATYYGYRLLDRLEPDVDAWLHFLRNVKPAAYRVDGTPGTTPVWQRLQNLADAKSTYGPIVYNKAPAVLRELAERLGEERFRLGMRTFLTRHAFGNARWTDLMAALAGTGELANRWSDRFILSPGMPRVTATHDADLHGITVHQQAVDGGEGLWPMKVDVLVIGADSRSRTIPVELDGAMVTVALGDRTDGARPQPPAALLVNPQDVAYGQFIPDERTLQFLLKSIGSIEEPLTRAVAWTGLNEAVREAELDPRLYAALVLDVLRSERDPETRNWLLSTFGTVVRRYLPADEGASFCRRGSELLHGQWSELSEAAKVDTFRFLARFVTDEATFRLCEQVHRGGDVAGVNFGMKDRFLAAAALRAAGRGDDAWDAMCATEHPETARQAYIHGAAEPTEAAKKRYFEGYLQVSEPPEQWMAESLPMFHWPGQAELTLPWLRPALEQALWVKANRRIFFMPTWLDAFVNGHSSVQALKVVDDFMQQTELPEDVRKKLLQSIDGLKRAVHIRARFG